MSWSVEKRRLSSILKSKSENAMAASGKAGTPNKVRFNDQSIELALLEVIEKNLLTRYESLVGCLRLEDFTDSRFAETLMEAKKCIPLMKPPFNLLVETLLAMRWVNRSESCIEVYKAFVVELLVAHKNFTTLAVKALIDLFPAKEEAKSNWMCGTPSPEMRQMLVPVHDLLTRLKNVIPMIFDVVLLQLRKGFPYIKKEPYEISSYVYNVLWMTEYMTLFSEELLDLVIERMLNIDVNAPRQDIENEEFAEEEQMFSMEVGGSGDGQDENTMRLTVAESLDCCMELMLGYIEKTIADGQGDRLFKIMLSLYELHILPSHNTDHVQFIMFYLCSFKYSYAEHFITFLWKNVCNYNLPAVNRQTSAGYIGSMLARAKYIPLSFLKTMLQEMSQWVLNYIERSTVGHCNQSLKVHLVFYSVCQALFYLIAFRSRHLTSSKKNIVFLQSLQLSTIVSCSLNPLRVCLPTVATAFAGMTRIYQLAYCHPVLEQNARRKLATVYKSNTELPEECLDTFFPFDPYLLKKSCVRINPLYLEYQANEDEEYNGSEAGDHHHGQQGQGKKRHESVSEDVDDFIPESKRHKHHQSIELGPDETFEYSYGVSPGF